MLDRPDELVHELRSPISAILAHANALLEGWQGRPEEAERLAAIRIQAQHLLRFLGRPEQGAARRERLAPLAPAQEAVRLFSGSARQRNLTLDCGGDGALPEWVELDATTVRLGLANLLGNALKFTNEGGVRLTVAAGAGRIRYTVSDTGIGMDAGQLARLRATCVQVHASSAGRGGQGLGLAAARRLAERAGGTLAIASLPGQGSSVSLELPLLAAGPVALAPSPSLASAEVLFVHLDDVACLALAAMLKGAGYSVTAIADPAEAVRRAGLAQAAGRAFRAVFLSAAGCQEAALLPGLAGHRLVAVGEGPPPAACQAQVSATSTRDELLAAIG